MVGKKAANKKKKSKSNAAAGVQERSGRGGGKRPQRPGGIVESIGTPLARHTRLVSGVPLRRNHALGEYIENSEYVGNVTVSVDSDLATGQAFQLKDFVLNAGDGATFPWLSIVAQGYEYYKFERLEFIFISRMPATVQGELLMVIDSDPSDPTPANPQELMVAPNAVTDNVWTDIECNAVPSALNNFVTGGGHGYYVSNGPSAQGSDARLVNCGRLWVATEGFGHTSAAPEEERIGTLIVRYRCKLSVPNSEKRLVVNGTVETPVTQPGDLLPKISRVYAGPIEPPALVNNVASRIFDAAFGVPTALPANGTNIGRFAADTIAKYTWRNLAQYFSPTKNSFILPKGRFLVEIANTVFAESVATVVQMAHTLLTKVYRPSTGETIVIDCTRKSKTYSAGGASTVDIHDTLFGSATLDAEAGDELWFEHLYQALAGADPIGKIYQSATDPSYATITQLGI
jgi:hypothetical protein